MKEVTHLPEPLRVGNDVHTENWSVSSDIGHFTVVEIFPDGWVKCQNAKGQMRMFARPHVKRWEEP